MRYALNRVAWRRHAVLGTLAFPLLVGTTVWAQPPRPQSAVGGDRQSTASVDDQQSDEIEYLTRGPLHEAFAEPYEADPAPTPAIPEQPPEPIDEVPPEHQPEGDNVSWIPGYWSWDEERNDFLWVSGVWREVPPGQRWVPGYWEQASEGHRWISGFWTSVEMERVDYLPPPPESLEQGPSSPAPGDNYFYVPGHYVYENDYQWQPGFWSRAQEDWVWVPAQYIWTPRGCVYRPGYWDYDVAQRGVVFTPVYYRQPVYRSPQYRYRPRYTIDTGLGLFVNLFVRPNYRHYYYGDYYGSRYSDNYYPWVTRYGQGRYYDPFYAQYRYGQRYQNNNLLSWITNQHRYFAGNEQYRPPRTIAQQRQFVQLNQNANIDPTVLRLAAFGDALDNVVNQDDSPLRFRSIDDDQIERLQQLNNPLRELAENRRRTESGSATGNANVDAGASAGDDVAANANADAGANVDGDGANVNANASARGQLELPRVDATMADARDTVRDARETTRETADNVGDTARNAAGNVGDTAGNAREMARDAARDAGQAADRAGRQAGQSADRARDAARDAADDVGRTAEGVTERMRSGGENAAENLRPSGDSARQAAEAAAGSTDRSLDQLGAAADQLLGNTGAADQRGAREAGEAAQRRMQQNAQRGTDAASDAARGAQDNAGNARDAARGASDAARQAQQAAGAADRARDAQRSANDLRQRAQNQIGDQLNNRLRSERMRPSRPDGWPNVQPRRDLNRTLPGRPSPDGAAPGANQLRNLQQRGNRAVPNLGNPAGGAPNLGNPAGGAVPGAGGAVPNVGGAASGVGGAINQATEGAGGVGGAVGGLLGG